MPLPPIGANPPAPALDLSAIAEQTAKEEHATDVDRVEAFRRRALEAYGGKVPASEKQAYAQALFSLSAPKNRLAELRASVDGADRAANAIGTARRTIVGMEGELGRLEADNQRTYDASIATITAMQNELSRVLTSRAGDDARMSAFFRIAANSDQSRRLTSAFNAYKTKQTEMRATLTSLKQTESELMKVDASAGAEDAQLLLFVQRQRGLQALQQNLEAQIELLRQMIAHASGTGAALRGVLASLEQSLAATKTWTARALDETSDEVLSRIFDVASFVVFAAMPPAAFAALGPTLALVRGALLKDVDGVRESAELFAWRAASRLLTAGLVEAGVGELAARAVVAALRETARHAAANNRAEASELVTAAVRGALGEGQAAVIDFLLHRADETLPLAALARAVIGLPSLAAGEAQQIVAELSRAGAGVDGALKILEAAAA